MAPLRLTRNTRSFLSASVTRVLRPGFEPATSCMHFSRVLQPLNRHVACSLAVTDTLILSGKISRLYYRLVWNAPFKSEMLYQICCGHLHPTGISYGCSISLGKHKWQFKRNILNSLQINISHHAVCSYPR